MSSVPVPSPFLSAGYGTEYVTLEIVYSGVYVKSDEEIVLQGASINDLTSEAFLVLPVHSLGYEYYVMSYDFHLVQGNGSKHAQVK